MRNERWICYIYLIKTVRIQVIFTRSRLWVAVATHSLERVKIPISAAVKLPQWNNCAFYDKSMKLLPLLVHTLRFILRCEGKLDLTPGDL